MKTAVSIPDRLFAAADREAKRLGISRSSFYARALEEYLARAATGDVTKRLDEVHATEESSMDPVLVQLQAMSLDREEW